MVKKILFLIIMFLYCTKTFAANKTSPWVGVDFEGFTCRGGEQGPGPYDYNTHKSSPKLHLVEKFHFTDSIKNLSSNKILVSNIDYTLRASPNHHSAILTLIRYQLRYNSDIKSKHIDRPLLSPVECYLQKAMHFAPKDAAVISLYAYYLKKIKRFDESIKMYEKAIEIDPENTKIRYAFSILLIKLKKFDKAVIHAKKAYEIGNPPPNLRNKLIKLGKWI